jgi:hypothetical protein
MEEFTMKSGSALSFPLSIFWENKPLLIPLKRQKPLDEGRSQVSSLYANFV